MQPFCLSVSHYWILFYYHGALPLRKCTRAMEHPHLSDVSPVQQTAARHEYLQGLRLVPFGLYCIFYALMYTIWWPQDGPLSTQPGPVGVAVVIACLSTYAIGAYYQRRTSTSLQLPRTLPWIAGYAACLLALVAGMAVDGIWYPPVSVFGLTLAALVVAYWWVLGKFQRYCLVLAGILAVVALAAPFLVEVTEMFAVSTTPAINLMIGAAGVACIAGGILDHRILVRTLTPAMPDDD